MSLSPGDQLGPYKIISPIGKGGMGEVYRAQDTRLGRDVAIKVLPEQLISNSEALRRFEREGKALAALSHPNILTIFDVGTDQGVSFVVMELLEGETLRNRLNNSALSCDNALEIAVPIAEGLSAAHSKGIVHRDLKPENIILTSDGRIKILDFGLARQSSIFSQQELTQAPTRSQELESVAITGTIPYMSPEQVMGKPVDARSDIFSFGCMLYEMLAGKRPFAGDSAAETIAAILKENPANLHDSGKQIPSSLEQVVSHCLEKNPEQRFQSARDLTFALKSASRDSTITEVSQPKTIQPKSSSSRVWIVAALMLLLIGASIYFFIRPKNAISSLAILPFINTSANPDNEYLSDGITNTLINNLSQVPKLKVMARGTVFTYKGKEVDPRKVGQDLKVNAVVTGSILQQGNDLLIQADLVNVADGSQLWGEQYKRHIADIITIQEEISKEIAAKLRLKLTGEEEKRLTKHYTENNEAYQLYLKGEYHWNRFTEEDLRKAIDYYNQAIAKDPSYALAYRGLGASYGVLGVQYWPPREAWPKAKAASIKAMQLDETLAEEFPLAGTKLFYEWDWASCEREFKNNVKFNNNNAIFHQLYSYYFEAIGKPEQAIAEMKRSMEIDPLSVVINSDLAVAYNQARQYDAAISQFKKTIELESHWGFVHTQLGSVYLQKGMIAEALQEMEKAEPLEPNAEVLGRVGHAHAVAGNRKEAEKRLEELMKLSKEKYVPPIGAAFIYIGLGDKDKAFEWLEKAYEERSGWFVWINDPIFDSIRSDPRFTDLLRRLKLPTPTKI